MDLLHIILALIILSILVVVHELGHFLAAKKVGIWAEEFGVGLPPKVWAKKIGETIYSLNALPIGGFVRMHGEVDQEEKKIKYPERAFVNKSASQRIFVAVAGVTMNILFAVLCFSAIYMFTGVPEQAEHPVITGIAPNSPAAEAGIQLEDQIVRLNDREVEYSNFADLISEHAGQLVTITLSDGTTKEIAIRQEAPEGEGLMGVAFSDQELVQPIWYAAPFVYLQKGIEDTWFWMQQTVAGFATLFQNVTTGQETEGVLGPVGITLTIAEFLKSGIVSVLGLAGIISINLAMVNMIPFPPLDGSRVLLIIMESIIGKAKVRKHEAKLHLAGMAVLLLLIAAMTIKEVPALIQAGSVSGFVQNILQ